MKTAGTASLSPGASPDPQLLTRLRECIRRIEGGTNGPSTADMAAVSFGDAAIDGHLPWNGLCRAGLHTLSGSDGAVTSFAAALLARFAGKNGTVLWCRRGDGLYGPGLAVFGLKPERLIVVQAGRPADCLWTMEESLRSGAPVAVFGEVEKIDTISARRLQLAAEAGGVAGLLLTGDSGPPLPAMTRWHIAAAPTGDDTLPFAQPRWQVALRHCRGGRPADWIMEWRDGPTGGFAVVADLCHRPPAPADRGNKSNVQPFRRAG